MTVLRKSQQTYDRVVVIESTTDSTNPGRDLIDHVLEPFRARHPEVDFTSEYHTPHSRDALFALLDRVAAETGARDGRPVLHLEIHSNEAGTGLSLANGDDVPWADLTKHLVALNRAAKGNLVVVLAVCFGERLSEVFAKSERAPAFGLVGPNDEITFGYFELAFRAFYAELLATGDGDEALRVLNVTGKEKDPTKEYRWRSAEGAFRDHLRFAIDHLLGSAKKRQQQVEDSISRAMKNPKVRGHGLAAIRKSAKGAARRVGRRTFEKMRDRYLMLDLFPEQRARYSLAYEDCVPLERIANEGA